MSQFTVALIKSDAVGRGDAPSILRSITMRGFYIAQYREFIPCPTTIRAFYHEHVNRDYFENLYLSIGKGKVIALVLKRDDDENVIKSWREHMGATNSKLAHPNTIRARFGGHVYNSQAPMSDNAVHGSDSEKAAEYEWSLIFSQDFQHP